MKSLISILAIGMAVAAILAGCGGTLGGTVTPVTSAQSRSRASGSGLAQHQPSHQRNAASEIVIYSFGSKTPDGIGPVGTLTDVRGILYGVTENDTEDQRRSRPRGIIFTVMPSGNETVLHEVTREQGSLLVQLTLGPRPGSGVALYGTGLSGGAHGFGTIVRATRSGVVSVLYNFADYGTIGWSPIGGLSNVNGTFYGTTRSGGAGSGGTVFSVTPSGSVSLVYAFRGGADGDLPEASPVSLNGTLYGTTYYGGTANFGTVYSLTPSGSEEVLYSFQGGNSDGANPTTGLIAVNGTLYGTTEYGGRYSGGTVFSITPSGSETILHSFNCVVDGCSPAAALLAFNGKMYGTTTSGGNSNDGTVFSVTPSGTERVLHAFTGGSDGATPRGGLINVRRTLYGTTSSGGTYDDGTVYSVTL